MHSVLRMEKKFSAMALSWGFSFLDMEGVIPYMMGILPLPFLPMKCRKSRSNLFSIYKRRISYAGSATMFLGTASFLGRPLSRGRIPASSLRSFLRSRSNILLPPAYLESIVYSRWVFPRPVLPCSQAAALECVCISAFP